MKINQLHHVAYAVNDYAQVQDFWKRLGFCLLQEQPESGTGEEKSIFWIGGVQIQLHPTEKTERAAAWRKRHTRDDLYEMCLEVENLEDAKAELEQAGIELDGGVEQTAQGRQFWISRKHTGEYDLCFLELKEELKHKETQEQQRILAKACGMEHLTAEEISTNGVGMTNIHHIGIIVSDYERARHLWKDVLHMDALYQHFKERDFKEDAMYLGDAQIHIYRSDNPELKFCYWSRQNGDGMATLSVCVDHINQTIRAIREAGMDISGDGPESMSQGMDVFIDKKYTGGNDFEIVELHYFLRGKSVEQQKKIVYHFFGEGTVL